MKYKQRRRQNIDNFKKAVTIGFLNEKEVNTFRIWLPSYQKKLNKKLGKKLAGYYGRIIGKSVLERVKEFIK